MAEVIKMADWSPDAVEARVSQMLVAESSRLKELPLCTESSDLERTMSRGEQSMGGVGLFSLRALPRPKRHTGFARLKGHSLSHEGDGALRGKDSVGHGV